VKDTEGRWVVGDKLNTCSNCGRRSDETMYGTGVDRRCGACRHFLMEYGEERPRELEEKLNKPKVKEGCKNLNCLKTEAEMPVAYYYGPERRCDRCCQHRRRYSGFEWPDKPEPAEPKVEDGCKNPNCRRTEAEMPVAHYFGPERRCHRCYRHRHNHPGFEWPDKPDKPEGAGKTRKTK